MNADNGRGSEPQGEIVSGAAAAKLPFNVCKRGDKHPRDLTFKAQEKRVAVVGGWKSMPRHVNATAASCNTKAARA